MTGHIREWLPQGVFTHDAVQAALAGLLEEWSQHWFMHRRAEVTATSFEGLPAEHSMVVGSETAQIMLCGRGKRHLVEALLGVELADVVIAPADHKLLDAFATDAAADLIARVEAMAPRTGRRGDRLAISLSLGGREMAFLFLPHDMLVPALKVVLRQRRRPPEALRRMAEALRPVRLRAAAVLGEATLALGDLRHLAIGDVVVLDTSVRDPVDLRLADNGRCIGRGQLGRDGIRPSIHF